MASVDVIAALDMFADKGEWDKCLQMAEQQVSAFSLSVICKQIFLKKNEEDAAWKCVCACEISETELV